VIQVKLTIRHIENSRLTIFPQPCMPTGGACSDS
jgi:hypothetical protein